MTRPVVVVGFNSKIFWNFAPRKFGEDVTPMFDSYFSNLGWFNHQLDVCFFPGKGFQVVQNGLFRAHRIHGTGIRYIYLLHEWLICNGKCRENINVPVPWILWGLKGREPFSCGAEYLKI